MRILIAVLLFFSIYSLNAQNFIDTAYNITTDFDIEYGEEVNFAGSVVSLHMDISYPTNTPTSNCGRPLALVIHGGAFAAGSKEDGYIKRMREEFAKRGYVAAAINYRLGFFQTNVAKNCNIPNWNCLNVADSSEWIRAWYRGVQDAKGALRYLINNASTYEIDPANVFVFGESAGAFISYGVAFLDVEAEKPASCFALDAVAAPHSNYYNPCIQGSTYDIPIASMDLTRPDLGSIQGSINYPGEPYVVRGVGSLYGGIFVNLFSQKSYFTPPALYIFHQPNDLVVPVGHDPVFKGFNTCSMQTNCVNIQHRPYCYGGQGVNDLIDTLSISLQYKPEIQLELTTNTADCVQQTLVPSSGGHQFDSYWTRTVNMATFFAAKIEPNDCALLNEVTFEKEGKFLVYPNPTENILNINTSSSYNLLTLYNPQGVNVYKHEFFQEEFSIDVSFLKPGLYLLTLNSGENQFSKTVIIGK